MKERVTSSAFEKLLSNYEDQIGKVISDLDWKSINQNSPKNNYKPFKNLSKTSK